MSLDRNFFRRDPIRVAKEILGCFLVRKTPEGKIIGKIVETEAYWGEADLACHASHGKTQRTETLYWDAGVLYVYLNYGIFHLTNIVCEEAEKPAAILLRAAQIVEGEEIARKHIKANKFVKENNLLATGPGKLSVAFNIDKSKNGIDIVNNANIYIDPAKTILNEKDIITTKRIGVDYAGPCKDYPWRFYIKNNKYISKP